MIPESMIKHTENVVPEKKKVIVTNAGPAPRQRFKI